MDQLRRKPTYLLLALMVFMGAFLRFYTIGSKTLWLDEAFSVWVAHHTLVDSWSWLIRIDQHPPLYYSSLHFWQAIFGDGQGAVRAFSALCSTLALPFFYGAVRRWFDKPTALIALFILAISPFHVRYAQETRMYALLTLAAAATLYFLAQILFDKQQSNARLNWIGLALAQAAVMLTHNTATIFFPLALNLGIGGALLWKYQQGGVSSLPALNELAFERRWLRSQLLAFVLWLPWSIPFIIQSLRVDQEFWIGAPTPGMVLDVLHNFNLAFLPDWLSLFHLWDLLYWVLAALGVYQLRRTPARALLLLSLCLTPFIGELIVSLRRPIFYERTLIWASLPYYMLLATGIRSLGRSFLSPLMDVPNGRSATGKGYPQVTDLPEPNVATERSFKQVVKALQVSYAPQSIAIIFLLLLSLLSLSNYYFYFQKEDWAKAADYVAHNVAPGDIILFNATWVQIPFEYYFRHYNTGAELRGLPVDLFDRGILEPKMAETDVPYMRNLLAGHKRVWLVYSHDWYTDPNKIIPRELNHSMHQVDQNEFVGLKILRFEAR
jgi:mannosyltransferase